MACWPEGCLEPHSSTLHLTDRWPSRRRSLPPMSLAGQHLYNEYHPFLLSHFGALKIQLVFFSWEREDDPWQPGWRLEPTTGTDALLVIRNDFMEFSVDMAMLIVVDQGKAGTLSNHKNKATVWITEWLNAHQNGLKESAVISPIRAPTLLSLSYLLRCH